jgi:hypothetical protein
MAEATITIKKANITGEGGNITNATITGEADLSALGTWGGAGEPFPTPPIVIPPNLGIWPSPGHPAHPIAPGGAPPEIWPSPGHPTHPIYYPPGIWGGGNEGFPTPPIVIPEPPTEPLPEPPKDRWHWHYDENLGWVLVPPTTDKPRPVGK